MGLNKVTIHPCALVKLNFGFVGQLMYFAPLYGDVVVSEQIIKIRKVSILMLIYGKLCVKIYKDLYNAGNLETNCMIFPISAHIVDQA